jgi:hypothetical protein
VDELKSSRSASVQPAKLVDELKSSRSASVQPAKLVDELKSSRNLRAIREISG